LTAAIITVSGGAEKAATPTSETSTTTESTTTTEPTTSTTSVEDAVREAHTRVMTEMYDFDSRVEGYEPILTEARELTTGPLLRRIEEDFAAKAAASEYIVASGYESNIVSIEIDGDHATVLDCSRDTGEVFDADGNLLVSAATSFSLRRSQLALIDGRWLVEERYSPSEETCDPEDYQ
jgi:hypothetical protein